MAPSSSGLGESVLDAGRWGYRVLVRRIFVEAPDTDFSSTASLARLPHSMASSASTSQSSAFLQAWIVHGSEPSAQVVLPPLTDDLSCRFREAHRATPHAPTTGRGARMSPGAIKIRWIIRRTFWNSPSVPMRLKRDISRHLHVSPV